MDPVDRRRGHKRRDRVGLALLVKRSQVGAQDVLRYAQVPGDDRQFRPDTLLLGLKIRHARVNASELGVGLSEA